MRDFSIEKAAATRQVLNRDLQAQAHFSLLPPPPFELGLLLVL